MDNEKLELTQEQADRLDEIDNAAQEYLKILTNNPDLEWDMEYIGELNRMAAEFMYEEDFQIYYPSIEIDKDGNEKCIVDYFKPDEAAERTVMLVLRDQDGLNIALDSFRVRTALSDDELMSAIKAAAQDYLNTPEGRKAWKDNGGNFNYGDFKLNVPDILCATHGFFPVHDDISLMEVDLNTILAKPKDGGKE